MMPGSGCYPLSVGGEGEEGMRDDTGEGGGGGELGTYRAGGWVCACVCVCVCACA